MAELPANCGITTKGKTFVLTYKVGKNIDKDKLSWDWYQEGEGYVAKFRAVTKSGDVKFHNSAPVDAATYEVLGKGKPELEGEFCMVKLKKGNVEDLHKFFDVPQ